MEYRHQLSLFQGYRPWGGSGGGNHHTCTHWWDLRQNYIVLNAQTEPTDPTAWHEARKGIPVTVQRRFDVYPDVSVLL